MKTTEMAEVRIKLHINFSNESEVKNLWMGLNYDNKPSISHVIDHVKDNLCAKKKGPEISDCKLYLDNYWLPPYENSRLLRENDCVKVEISYEEKREIETTSLSKKYATLNQNVLDHLKQTEKRISENQANSNCSYASKTLSAEEIATVETASNLNYYNHYYDNNNFQDLKTKEKRDINYYNYWTNNDLYNKQINQQKVSEDTNKTKSIERKNEATTNTPSYVSPSKKAQTKISKPVKEVTKCNRKFAIGGFVHCLNENVELPITTTSIKKGKEKNNKKDYKNESDNLSEEQIIDKYYMAVQDKKSNEILSMNQKMNENSVDFDKISANVNSTGRQKWKGSTQQTKTNAPKHTIFRSSDSSSSSSDSSSESDGDIVQKNTIKALDNENKKNLESTKLNKFYEPNKEEQLNSASYSRSYYIKNTKNLNEFKKTFNEEKLNAPQSEKFIDTSEYPKKTSKKTTRMTPSVDNQATTIPTKLIEGSKSPSVPKICYDKFENLIGSPRLNDKIAFKILEISTNFTPEISDYKTGTVIEFDKSTNEITLKMNNKYNQVLKRPSKFSVVLDETDIDAIDQEEEIMKQKSNHSMEDTLKVDWRNLINLKLCPNEKLIAKYDKLDDCTEKTLNSHV